MDGRCLLCGRPADRGASCCPTCADDMGPAVVLDDPFGRPATSASTDGDQPSKIGGWLGGLAAVAALAMGALALLAPGDGTESTADEASQLVQLPTPTPFIPIPTPEPTVPAVGPAAIAADATSRLPDMAATHIAVARGQDVAFLDLSTGLWTLHKRTARPVDATDDHLVPFGDGVVTIGLRGDPTFVSPDEPGRVLSSGSLLGVHDGVAFVRNYRGGNQSVAAVAADGVVRAMIDLPPVTVAREVTVDGLVLVEGPDGVLAWAGEADAALVPASDGERRDAATEWLQGVRSTDLSGTHVRVDGDRLLFHGPTGDPITEVALDLLTGEGDYALALVTMP